MRLTEAQIKVLRSCVDHNNGMRGTCVIRRISVCCVYQQRSKQMRTTRIEQLELAFRAYGYIVTAEPIEGQEDQFAKHLSSGLSRIEEFMKVDARQHGFRGLSKRALQSLHLAIPDPVWGVEVR